MRRVALALAAAVTGAALFLSVRSALEPTLAGGDEIQALLVDHVDTQKKSLGTVIGVLTPAGRRIHAYGKAGEGDPKPLGGDTVFEVGSVSKIITALLLAEMVERGQVGLDDPVAKHLPDLALPEWKGRRMTLADLATHTSGLPLFPDDIPLSDPSEVARVVARYSVEDSHRFLARYDLPQETGSRWTYSNLGYALLGEALARRAGTNYETLVRERITRPLGLASTAFTVSASMRKRLARGHDAALHPVPELAMPAFLPAAGLRSTANDLLTLLEAFTGRRSSPLAPAMARMLETRRPGPGLEQALGWWLVRIGPEDEGFVAFGGQTAGFATTIAFDPKTRVGVVVLSNGAQDDGGIGWHLLRPAFPVTTAAVLAERRQRVAQAAHPDPGVLDSYAGRFRVASGPTAGDIVTIERTRDGLALHSNASPPSGLRLYARDGRTFFPAEVDLEIAFERDGQGTVTGIVIGFAGMETRADRVSEMRGRS